MWNAPTVRFICPANIPNLIGHNALSAMAMAMAMATPVAHKGAAAGAKVVAMHPTYLDQLGIKYPNVAASGPG